MSKLKSHWAIVYVCVLVSSLLLLSACAGQPPVAPEAIRHYEAGMAFQNADEWEKAAQEFEAVLKLAGSYKDTAERYGDVITKWKAATLTAVPSTRVPIQNTSAPRPTYTPLPTYSPLPTYTPQATAPDVSPVASSTPRPVPHPVNVTLTVKSTYQGTCRIVLWGPADIVVDAGKDFPGTRTIKPGTYGWRAFVNGRETGQADSLVARMGDTCSFTCDSSSNTIWWGCE